MPLYPTVYDSSAKIHTAAAFTVIRSENVVFQMNSSSLIGVEEGTTLQKIIRLQIFGHPTLPKTTAFALIWSNSG